MTVWGERRRRAGGRRRNNTNYIQAINQLYLEIRPSNTLRTNEHHYSDLVLTIPEGGKGEESGDRGDTAGDWRKREKDHLDHYVHL